MDANRFDAIVRALGSGSRRRVFGVLSGLTIGALASPVERPGAEARTGKGHKKKKKKKTCRTLPCTECAPCDGGTCQPKPEGTPCALPGGGGQCLQGQCLRVIPCNPATTPSTCPTGQVLDPNTCQCVTVA